MKQIKYIFLFTSMTIQVSMAQSIEREGMTLNWQCIDDATVQLELIAPTTGWIAIGINETPGLVKSNLIMAHVNNGECILSDRFVVGFGDHRPVQHLGGKEHARLVKCEETETITSITFILDAKPKDRYHYHITAGEKRYISLAYATHDDFDHHSIMRTQTQIIF